MSSFNTKNELVGKNLEYVQLPKDLVGHNIPSDIMEQIIASDKTSCNQTYITELEKLVIEFNYKLKQLVPGGFSIEIKSDSIHHDIIRNKDYIGAEYHITANHPDKDDSGEEYNKIEIYGTARISYIEDTANEEE